MCLSINSLHYDTFEEKYIPKTAECDLEVYKALMTADGWKYVGGKLVDHISYYTPFQGVEVKFKDGQCLKKANGNGAHLGKRINWEINQGIHSMLSRTHYVFSKGSRTKWFHAVIPKGTNYFIGTKDDVVSEKLLIFESDKDYENYCKENSIGQIAK